MVHRVFFLAPNSDKQTYEIFFEGAVDPVGQNNAKADLFLFPSGTSLYPYMLNLI